MTPAQAKKVFGRTTVRISFISHRNLGFDWRSDFVIGGVNGTFIQFSAYRMFGTREAARRHAREFFKKLGLKVRFGK